MEENRDENLGQEETKAEYTGEYGNSVEGEYKAPEAPSAEQIQNARTSDSQAEGSNKPQAESSLYSYNYQNGNSESTHSGDYYENRNSGSQDSSTAASSSGQNSTYNSQSSESTGNSSQSAGTVDSSYSSQSTGTTGSSYSSQNAGAIGNNSYQNTGNPYGSQNQYYQNTNYAQSGGNNQMQNVNNEKPPKKNGSSIGMKILVTAVCAVLFGVIAGTCFQAVNLVTERIIGTTQVEQIEKTTTDTNNQEQNNISSNSGKTVINNTVTDVSAITEQTMPALVAITSTTKGTDYYDLFGQYYAGQDTTSCGTGIIVGQNDKELLIATNNHVISGAKTISIQFIDGEIYEATEKGSDSANDLAVVAVKVSSVKKDTMGKIKIADLGNSDEAKVGQMVIAIGNALGYGQSITVGWISAKDREITESSEDGKSVNKIKAIQTDAAINPGNSGGALINMQGQVIGINSAKIADSTVEGVGYAIPISVATPIIDDLMNREILEDSEKGYLGIQGSTVSEAASAYNIPYGVHVKEVAKGGAAEKAGIMANDIITAVNKMEVTTIESLQEKVNSYRKGTEVEITLQRSSNGKYEEKVVKVTLQGSESLDSLPDDSTDNNNGNNGNNEYNGGNNGNEYGNNYGNDYGNGGGNNGGNNGSGNFWDYFFN